ncbi:unannotated protein [freshwater metagenome]|uniref:Unannotated protein n=1 Tax=freshwater metagenome TaxID=449393 RepID=A0A6J6QJS7_9ZZZZ
MEHAPRPQYQDELKAFGRELAAIVDPLLGPSVHGWRKRHSVATAVAEIRTRSGLRIHGDIASFFSNVDQVRLRKMVDRVDSRLWARIEPWLPEIGLPEGCAISPPLANLYLTDIDSRFPIVRFADNLLLIDPNPEPLFHTLRRHLTDIGLVITPSSIEHDPTHFCKTALAPFGAA